MDFLTVMRHKYSNATLVLRHRKFHSSANATVVFVEWQRGQRVAHSRRRLSEGGGRAVAHLQHFRPRWSVRRPQDVIRTQLQRTAAVGQIVAGSFRQSAAPLHQQPAHQLPTGKFNKFNVRIKRKCGLYRRNKVLKKKNKKNLKKI